MRTTRLRSTAAWLAVAALFFSVLGLSTGAGAQSASDDPAQVDAGKEVFESNCAGCHGEDGTGSALGRPLTGIADQQPDRSVHFTSVTEGKGNMPAFDDRLDAEQIDAVISYVRLTFVAPEEPEAEEEAPAAEEAEEPEATADDAEAADEDDAAPQLALTGAETPLLAIAGLSLVAAGLAVTRFSRRID